MFTFGNDGGGRMYPATRSNKAENVATMLHLLELLEE